MPAKSELPPKYAKRNLAVKSAAADIIAKNTSNAHSYHFYRPGAWRNIAYALLDDGYSPIMVEYILRSKFMRWCDDSRPNRYGTTSAKFAIEYLRKRKAEIDDMLKNECDMEMEGVVEVLRYDPSHRYEIRTKTKGTSAKKFHVYDHKNHMDALHTDKQERAAEVIRQAGEGDITQHLKDYGHHQEGDCCLKRHQKSKWRH